MVSYHGEGAEGGMEGGKPRELALTREEAAKEDDGSLLKDLATRRAALKAARRLVREEREPLRRMVRSSWNRRTGVVEGRTPRNEMP